MLKIGPTYGSPTKKLNTHNYTDKKYLKLSLNLKSCKHIELLLR